MGVDADFGIAQTQVTGRELEEEIQEESQTQEDTQFPAMAFTAATVAATAQNGAVSKRRTESEYVSANKKFKISIGDGVDMEE